MRNLAVPTLVSGCLAAVASAQTVDFQAYGGATLDRVGAVLTYGDHSSSLRMLFVGVANDDTAATNAGAVRVYRQDLGTLDTTLFGGAAFDRFGTALSTSGDLDGDGRRDLLVGAPGADPGGVAGGGVHAFSGADFSEFPWSPVGLPSGQAGSDFGAAVAIVGDRDGDGRDDFVVGAPNRDTGVFTVLPDAGAVYLFSGADGSQLDARGGTEASSNMGFALARGDDHDGDGDDDVLVGQPGFDGAAGADTGRALVLAVATLDDLPGFAFEGPKVGTRLGHMVAGGGDPNGDGTRDLLLGAPDYDAGFSPFVIFDVGRAELRSGVDGSLLSAYQGSIGEQLGFAGAIDGDLNHDGRDDVLLGAPAWNGGDGAARAWSGRTGECFYDFTGVAGERLGEAVALGRALPNNVEVYADFAVGRPKHDVFGFPTKEDAGAVDQYHGKTKWLLTSFPGLGRDVDVMEDVDGDGVDDILTSVFRDDEFPMYGWSLRSGKDGHVLREDLALDGCAGSSLCALPDITGDGVADFVLGSPCDQTVRLHSGQDGSQVWKLGIGSTAFGSDVDAAGDVNDDLLADVVVGDPSYDGNRGRAYVYKMMPSPGVLASSSPGASVGDKLGFSVAGLGDVDGDLIEDYAAGAPYEDVAALTDAGAVHVVSGATGLDLFTVDGLAAGDRTGWSVAGVGDVNGDGFADVAVGEPYASPNGLLEAGRVRVVAGPDGSDVLHEFEGSQAGMHLGWRVSRIGDADRDGLPDVAFSAPDWDWTVFAQFDVGAAYVHSGASGDPLGSFFGPEPLSRLGLSLGGRMDAGVDDRNELAMGSAQGLYDGNVGLVGVDHYPAASVGAIGVACGDGVAFTPQLSTSPALLGELMTFTVDDAELSVAVLWVALAPTSIPLGSGCELYVDPTTIAATLVLTGAGTSLDLEVLVPAGPAAVGLPLYAQALVPLTAAPLGFGLTRANRLVLGY